MKKSIYLLSFLFLAIGACKEKNNPTPDTDSAGQCESINMSVAGSVSGSTVTISAANGLAPYTYAVDNDNFVDNPEFKELKYGTHAIKAKDRNGCTAISSVTITSYKDERGNTSKIYPLVKIGNQVWMAKNLNYIPSTGNSWCFSNNNSNCDTYGRLYDHETALEACPNGFRLPSDDDWKDLERALGMTGNVPDQWDYRGSNEGTKLKVDGTSGFNALMGGLYNPSSGNFSRNGEEGLYWTATLGFNPDLDEVEMGQRPIYRSLSPNLHGVGRYTYPASYGLSVRCIQNAD